MTEQLKDRYGQPIRVSQTRKDEYKERYEAKKKRGESFYPFTLFKDGLVSLVIFLIILALAVKFGAETEAIADPTDTTYNPRPEWYFLFLFELLKYFPGYLEAVGAIILPGLFILALLLLPFYDRSRHRHPLNRPIATGLGIFVLAGIVFLTYRGTTAQAVNVAQEVEPVLAEGKRLYRELNCAYCHSVEGSGGTIGPDLTNIGQLRQDAQWLMAYFRDPPSMLPGSKMPKFQLLDDELRALTAYVMSLGAPIPYSAEAPKLFAAQCAMCHTTNGKGGGIGPDLSEVGKRRAIAWMKSYIENPKATNSGATMPAFAQFSADQLEDMARYMANFRGVPTGAGTR